MCGTTGSCFFNQSFANRRPSADLELQINLLEVAEAVVDGEHRGERIRGPAPLIQPHEQSWKRARGENRWLISHHNRRIGNKTKESFQLCSSNQSRQRMNGTQQSKQASNPKSRNARRAWIIGFHPKGVEGRKRGPRRALAD
jgi:hypothetical protein